MIQYSLGQRVAMGATTAIINEGAGI